MQFDRSFFGHPRGLATLFFTEMWERFSYYGMRALLLLFMVAGVEKGGMGMEEKTAGAIYGLYTMFVYLMSLPGGWLADKLFGLRKAVFYGGCIIAAGHFLMVVPDEKFFFTGLLFIIIGTGLLKPNISSMVGGLYAEGDQARRDAGFSIFYMGINLGAFISPLITGYLGQKINWHYGFAAAGLGMLLGLIQYKVTEKYLGNVGLEPEKLPDPVQNKQRESRIRIGLVIVVVILAVLISMMFSRVITVNPVMIASVSGFVLLTAAIIYMIYVFIAEDLSSQEKKRVLVIAILFIFSTTFYAGYEQQGSSLNLFAERYTDLHIFGWEMPASWLQSAPPIFSVLFAPVFALLWVWTDRRNIHPSIPIKFSMSLVFMGLGFAIMIFAANIYIGGEKPWSTWLITTFLLHTFGEICLYPVGLSAVTKLAPRKLAGQMMGVWFMSLALGNLMAGLYTGEFSEKAIQANPAILPTLFWLVTKIMVISGLVILVLAKPIRKLMGDIR